MIKKYYPWLFAFVIIAVFGLIVGLLMTLIFGSKSSRDQSVKLAVGDSYELVSGRKIVLLSMNKDTTCSFRLIECTEKSCVVLESFSLSLKGNDTAPPADVCILGFKLRLMWVDPKDQKVAVGITKL